MSVVTENDAAAFAELAAVLFTLPVPVAIIDLETTGGHFEQDRITEIAILRFHQGVISRHQWLVNPQQPICDFITQLTGISNAMVLDAPVFADIAPELLPLLRGHLIVAHNSRFDYAFLRHAFARVQICFAALTLDTVPLSRKLYPQYFKHNLDVIIERFHIAMKKTERHRAMGDVLALTNFLQESLREKKAAVWLSQWQQLIRPGYLPSWISNELCQQIYALPDSPGLLLWHFANEAGVVMMAQKQAFTETILLLRQKHARNKWQQATAIRFIPAISLVHALYLQGCYYVRHGEGCYFDDDPVAATNWYTISFIPNQGGQLQARVVRLKEGILTQAPYGLFMHPKAAKRALASWARQYDLCPASLDILPQSISQRDPCPKQAAQQCDGHCRKDEATATQNQRILHHALLLPVCEWGKWHHLRITEVNCVTAESTQMEFQAGCVRVNNGHWYFHPLLPTIIKSRLKQSQGIEFLR
ncbi:MAG: 3'-5' exonuclease [Snodgrassella sp.]|nr:3'-5' exonuclease [Snodgrassella sp.]